MAKFEGYTKEDYIKMILKKVGLMFYLILALEVIGWFREWVVIDIIKNLIIISCALFFYLTNKAIKKKDEANKDGAI